MRGAKQSKEMTKVLDLIDNHKKTPAEAIRIVGNITAGAVSTALRKRREKQDAPKNP